MYEKLVSYAAKQLELDPDDISRDSTFESLGIDSLDIVEMLMGLEETFNITVPEEEAVNIKTVGDIVKLIEEKN